MIESSNRSPDDQESKNKRGPCLNDGRRIGEPLEHFDRIDVMIVDEKSDWPIDPEIADHHEHEANSNPFH
jgi:hypothetical protein